MEASINRNRRMGIEIEVVCPIVGVGGTVDVQRLLADVLTRQGIQAQSRNYSRAPVPRGCDICVEHDASLEDESRFRGIQWAKLEVKTRPMQWEDVERVVPQTLEIVRYLGARCNASTGLHIHHEFSEAVERPEVVRNLMNTWWRFHSVMYGMVAPSRRSSQYCRPPLSSDITRFANVRTYEQMRTEVERCDRYFGLNLQNLADRQRMTVEWRLHSGTTDWHKIFAWTIATQRWVEHAVRRSCQFRAEPVENSLAGLNALFVTTGLRVNSRVYRRVEKDIRKAAKFLRRRWKLFNLPRDFKDKAIAA